MNDLAAAIALIAEAWRILHASGRNDLALTVYDCLVELEERHHSDIRAAATAARIAAIEDKSNNIH